MDLRDRSSKPFFTTKARGGGLGLPIAKRVAELHGGTLALTFPASGGMSVTITAPAAPRAEGTLTVTPAAAASSRWRLLVGGASGVRTSRSDTGPDPD